MKRLFALFLSLMAIATIATAQTTTSQSASISQQSGKLFAIGVGSFASNGWNSLWRHNQLPLTLVVSDDTYLTESGQLSSPANNMSLDSSQGLFAICGGGGDETHLSVSLPRGYRFTGYRMVMLNNLGGKTLNSMSVRAQTLQVFETNSQFEVGGTSRSAVLAKTDEMPASTSDTTEYVLERNADDMGNNLYFYFYPTSGVYQYYVYGVTIKSLVVYYTVDQSITVSGTADDNLVSDGVKAIDMPFATGQTDLGTITKGGSGASAYFTYSGAEDMTANNALYEEDAVESGTLATDLSGGKIQKLQNGGNTYYALGNGTYYIETPTTASTSDGRTYPVGYRATSAKLNYHYGTAQEAGTVADGYYIIARQSQTFYLGTNYGSTIWSTVADDQTGIWTMEADGTIHNQNGVYLSIFYDYYNYRYFIGFSTFSSYSWTKVVDHAVFKLDDNGYLTTTYNGQTYYFAFNGNANYNNMSTTVPTRATSYGATELTPAHTKTNPAFTPGDYTLTLYGTSATEAVATANITSTTADGTLSAPNLNNDAVKFTVGGLPERAKALLTFDLELEALNPAIRSIDVACVKAGGTEQVAQTVDASEYQIGDSTITIDVPASYAQTVDGKSVYNFQFANLYNSQLDDTYGKGTTGNGRDYLVQSEYYKQYGDGQHHTTKGTEAAGTKVVTAEAGNVAFPFTNLADFSATATTTPANIVGQAFTMSAYQAIGGAFSTVQVAVGEEKTVYLFVGDETRYHIAPTTTDHRLYACYSITISPKVAAYSAKCELTKVYDQTCYAADNAEGYSTDAMYGARFTVVDADGNATTATDATLTVAALRSALTAALTDGITAKQVLYLDLTAVPAVSDADAIGTWRTEENANCLVFLSATTTASGENTVQYNTSRNRYQTIGNIVLTDKQPFYSPYDFTVLGSNNISYSRKVTVSKNGKVTWASIILPFNINLDDGTLENDDCTLDFYQMQSGNCLSAATDRTSEDYSTEAHFGKASKVNANTPYLVNVASALTGEQTSFSITHSGTTSVKATSSMSDAYTFSGESATGSIGDASYTFQGYGSFSGKVLDKADGYFYFASNKFVNSKELLSSNEVKMFPFRGYYSYATSNGAKGISAFGINADGTSTAINALSSASGLMIVSTGRGTMTVATVSPQRVRVASTAGATIANRAMKSGEHITLHVPAGVYIVNNTKVVVK